MQMYVRVQMHAVGRTLDRHVPPLDQLLHFFHFYGEDEGADGDLGVDKVGHDDQNGDRTTGSSTLRSHIIDSRKANRNARLHDSRTHGSPSTRCN